MNLFQTRAKAVKTLKTAVNPAGRKLTETPELDADILLQHILKQNRTWLMVHREYELSEDEEKAFTEAVSLRCTGLPVAYITGHKEFYGYDFAVTPDVLIPKPDTEVLIDHALNYLGQQYSTLEGPGGTLSAIPEVCDMCSGSGCVGISILKALQENDGIEENNLPKMTFADISLKALAVTRKNAAALLSDNCQSKLRFAQSNLFDNVPFKYDIIVTNPPYVPHSESIELLKDGRKEPLLALDGDVSDEGDWTGTEDGLSLIRRLIPQCREHLVRGGVLLMETGEYNAEETARLFEEAGFKNVHIEKDMNGRERDVIGEKF